MTITSKYQGRCRSCGRQIAVGEQIDWQRGKGAAHLQCPEAATTSAASRPLIALVAGGAQHAAGRNRRPASCDHCGEHLAAGAGRLVRCIADSGCMQHFDDDGWHVYCLDDAACKVRQDANRAAAQKDAEERKAAAAAKKITDAAISAEYDAVRESATAGLVQVDSYLDGYAQTEILASRKGFYDQRLTRGTMRGHVVVVEYSHAYDDDRYSVYAPRALAEEITDELASGLTCEAAAEWLSRYRGCLGTEVYEHAAVRGE